MFGANNWQNKKRPLIEKRTITVKSASPKPKPLPLPRASKPRQSASPKPPRRSSKQVKAVSRTAQTAKLQKSRPSEPTVDFGSEDSDEDDDDDVIRGSTPKRVRRDDSEDYDLTRKIRDSVAFQGEGEQSFSMVHAADLPALDKATKYEPYFAGLPEGFEVQFQYPSRSQKERFLLVRPSHDDHAFDALKDMVEVMHKVAEHYLPESEHEKFDNEENGFPQRLSRAANKKSQSDIMKVILEWNSAITDLVRDGTVISVLDSTRRPHQQLVERILNQTYSRTVSPKLKLLHMYEAGTDNVYGELMPKFISKILREDIKMTSDQVFVDLGSGVGNVALQAALEIGCESWGCEIMTNYCDVAKLQREEFLARCRLWGLSLGDVHLEQGDFLTNTAISRVLERADVVLVNNQVFTPQLNNDLIERFLDLKDGCRVVSLKSFVPADHKISNRNLNSPYNLLEVKQKDYWSGSVSWTSNGGTYFVSTKDSTRIKKFLRGNRLL